MANQGAYSMGFLWLLVVVAAYGGVALVRRWTTQRLLDVPNERSSHSRPTPRGGGLPIVACTLVGLWGMYGTAWLDLPLLPVLSYTLGALVVAAVSWGDDLWSLSNRVRFLAHAGGALLVLGGVGYGRQLTLPFVDVPELGWLGAGVAFFWIVGLTNAYNFMDGIDGIAGGQAVLAGVAWMGLGVLVEAPLCSLLGALLAGSSLGFLGHNWPPARIFMGDVGSAFLGYTFAVLALLGHLVHPRLGLAGVLVVWPFVFDTALTLLRRLRRRENIFAAHRSHLYQRLVIAGCSHRYVTLLYLGLAFCGVLLALAWSLHVRGSRWFVCVGLGVLGLGLWRYVVRVEARRASVVVTRAQMV